MSPRPPSSALVVDANIILSASLGLRSRPVFEAVLARRTLLTSVRAREEVLGTATRIDPGAGAATKNAMALLETVICVEASFYEDRLDEAAAVLRHAVASRNGSTNDSHILALAWALDADIWSHDRDFAGTGWPSWSNANLRASLEREASPHP